MLSKLEDSLNQALDDGYQGLWATGDMTWEFSPEKDFSKLLEYEWQLEELFHKRPELCGICQYHRDTLPPEAMRSSLLAHQSIVINDTLSQINPYYMQSKISAGQIATVSELDEKINKLCQLEN
jgi:DNA gyrase inhibitor GyrI